MNGPQERHCTPYCLIISAILFICGVIVGYMGATSTDIWMSGGFALAVLAIIRGEW